MTTLAPQRKTQLFPEYPLGDTKFLPCSVQISRNPFQLLRWYYAVVIFNFSTNLTGILFFPLPYCGSFLKKISREPRLQSIWPSFPRPKRHRKRKFWVLSRGYNHHRLTLIFWRGALFRRLNSDFRKCEFQLFMNFFRFFLYCKDRTSSKISSSITVDFFEKRPALFRALATADFVGDEPPRQCKQIWWVPLPMAWIVLLHTLDLWCASIQHS